MENPDVQGRVTQLAEVCDRAHPTERMGMQTEVQSVIRSLKSKHQPVPTALQRINNVLEQDSFDDMFDNMPV